MTSSTQVIVLQLCVLVYAWFGWLPNQNVGLRLFCEHLEVVKYLLLV